MLYIIAGFILKVKIKVEFRNISKFKRVFFEFQKLLLQNSGKRDYNKNVKIYGGGK